MLADAESAAGETHTSLLYSLQHEQLTRSQLSRTLLGSLSHFHTSVLQMLFKIFQMHHA